MAGGPEWGVTAEPPPGEMSLGMHGLAAEVLG